MQRTLFTNVNIFDGTGSPAFPGEILIDGDRIERLEKGRGSIIPDGGTQVIDGRGGLLMPGLVEPHAHMTYNNLATVAEQGDLPPEETLLLTLKNTQLMLDSGFTSLYSAGSARMRTEVVVKAAIDSRRFAGPRMRSACPEITTTGGLGDVRKMHKDGDLLNTIADGADAVLAAVRTAIREGVDTIKMNLSGDDFQKLGEGKMTMYDDHEIAAGARIAHDHGVFMACHARSDDSVRLALRHGFRSIYHCDYVEGETFDLLEEQKDRIFLAPAIGVTYATAYEAAPWGIDQQMATAMHQFEMLDNFPEVYGEIRKRGIRFMPGGDYGFAWNPIGNNARDLQHFVEMLGMSPAEVLMTVTKWGGELMAIDQLGLLREGWLADVILIDGDPLEDIRILQDRDNIVLVVKGGDIFKLDMHYFNPEVADRGAQSITASGPNLGAFPLRVQEAASLITAPTAVASGAGSHA
ncbi:amidohydrolase family protein [Mycolicibacterium fortuitum]